MARDVTKFIADKRRVRREGRRRRELGCSFVHINKTGGTSVCTALGIGFRHRTAMETIAEHGAERWSGTFSFAFVRNPWDRAVSQYHYAAGRALSFDPAEVGFEDWLRAAFLERDPGIRANSRMFLTQTQWIADQRGEVLVDFVGRFESLADDFATVCAELGTQASLPHLKPSSRGAYRDYFTDETRGIVGSYYAEDVERFGYTFA